MKGISPIVAAVLLIAITMSIAGILAYWSASYVEKSLPSETSTTCSLGYFTFETCKYNSTTRDLVFTLNNKRSIDLTNLTAIIIFNNGSASEGIKLSGSLPGNSIKSFSVSDVPPDFAEIKIKTHCIGVENKDECVRY
ncbi:MAG: archaellin/type IV pilin N-terminal domain-containing protein [Candidatus Aenigmatarchaeota archaeon]